MDREPNGSSTGRNITSSLSISTTPIPTSTSTPVDPKEYYKSYDVMTGVRIAATLGSFFGLMVLLVLYKSKSKTEKAMEDPKFTAAAVAEVEEEERQLQMALEATAYQQLNPRRTRLSLDTTAGWSRPSTRFSSVGGYSGLMAPPVRVLSGRGTPYYLGEEEDGEEEEEEEEAGSLYEDMYYNSHLNVPRRPSNITCSSSGSSYLERRDSAVACPGLPAPPSAHKNRSSTRRQSSPLPEIYACHYPIDIRVTQPTPGGSPCGSDRALHDSKVVVKQKLAPLASISSCNSSLGTDYPDCEPQSYTSDSVFQDDLESDDTDREIEEFSTDSDANSSEAGACCVVSHKRLRLPVVATNIPIISTTVFGANVSGSPSSYPDVVPEFSSKLSKSSSTLVEGKELSQLSLPATPEGQIGFGRGDGLPRSYSQVVPEFSCKTSKSSSTLVEGKELSQLSLNENARRLSVSSERLDERSWAQETLF